MSNRDLEQFEFKLPFVPATPFRPVLPKPSLIQAVNQGNQTLESNYTESKSCSSGLTQKVACSDSGICIEVNGGDNNLKAAIFGNTCVSYDRNGQMGCPVDLTELTDVPFADLLPVTTAASSSSVNAAPDGINIHHAGCNSEGLFTVPVHVDLSSQKEIWIDGNCTPKKHQDVIPPQNYDNNQPSGKIDAVSQTSISDFAPITPKKATTTETKGALDTDNINVESRITDELAAARVDGNGTQSSKEHSEPVTESSLATITENHNPDDEGNNLIELDRTPQQKQRRKKHRPKVITESKPRKPRKQATPNPNSTQEKPTCKRKYVRKNSINKDTSTSPGEANAQNSTHKRKYVRRKGLKNDSVSPTENENGEAPAKLERNKRPCRRALDFDVEGKENGESLVCKSACNLDSGSGADNVGKEENQSKATVQLCGRIEVANTETDIAYELNRSLNQKLKDYISLPEGQAPCTPLPTKINPPCRRRSAHSVKLNNKTGNDQTIDHNGLEENGQTMLHFNAQLPARRPNDCNYSNSSVPEGGQASELKINTTTTTLEEDSHAANSYGSHYNNLYTYHMIPGMQFSKIHRKKRSDKAQNSATSSTSSSITATRSCVSAETYVVDNNKVNPRQVNSSGVLEKSETGSEVSPDKFLTFNCIMALSQADTLKRKRTRGTTRVRDLASFNGIANCSRGIECCSSRSPVNYNMQEAGQSDRPPTSIEALVTGMQAKLAKKKRTKKRNSLVDSVCSSTYEAHKKLFLSSHNKFSAKLLGAPPEAIWEQMYSVDELVEQFNHLGINRKGPFAYQQQTALIPYNMRYQEQNALVLYRDGTMVPFVPIKKRRPRPKVDLDEETNRVWKLLLGNINSEGIDGTDEEKAKWWEEERRVFRGRADSFIARMHLVQGDRRFSPWKGSVLDSVIGVFLTQNVSDHLSSSAFMSLAAHFPLKSKSKDNSCHQQETSLMNGAEFYVLEPEDSTKWDTKSSIQPVSDQNSMIVNSSGHSEEKEAVNSMERNTGNTETISSIYESMCKPLNSSGTGLDTYCNLTLNRSNMELNRNGTESIKGDEETNDVLSSQNSVVSSENSVDFSMVQTAERAGSCSESNSEGGCQTKWPIFNLDGSPSFVQLLQMVGSSRLHEVYSHQNMPNIKNSSAERSQLQNDHEENCDNSEVPKSFIKEAIIPPPIDHPHHSLNSGVRENERFEMFKEETRSSEASKTKDGTFIKGQSPLTEESACQIMDQNDSTMSLQIQQDKATISNCQVSLLQDPRNLADSSADTQNKELLRCVNMSKHSGEILDITESNITFDNQRSPKQKMKESNFYTHNSSSNKELHGMNAGTSKSKGRKTKKETNEDFDWDSLRKQAEANCRKREKTEKTMDSLDWEAVRCADVNEIANTIKERGMNNMLAARIKDFLNRLVREHGSIDLEWLRDVPPDKAKEYLLSVRGLGLKSVECVRLLTLHHLAFPVDTNVGRIAVRLGWVPLQPLPESLQLHLLELYPVLESIQKYLWPRLCKLDQRTLYELHYQMITFGKVFCTKNKPNCNACPMRGECRHFASAFASARLALPGPEDKSIVSTTENRRSNQNDVNQLVLPLPQPTEQADRNWQFEKTHLSEASSGVKNCEPIVEEPASPEPEYTLTAENDIEEIFYEDPDEIPTIKLNIEEFTQNLQNYMQNNMELQEGDMSKALVALTAEAASIPTPKLKNVSRLRTEHQVYELPDSHPLLKELDKREPDDPCKYLLAIWTPGETANSIQPPERRCDSHAHGKLCDEKTCFSCNCIREAESQIVRGTLLIPCRTAMRGSFPLNGTYFQVNEVFADHDSSLNPIDVPREWLWNLPRRMVYFGTSIPSIFKGLTTEGIQQCFWRGFVCVRGFDQKTRAPRPLMARLHFPASKLTRGKGGAAGEDE